MTDNTNTTPADDALANAKRLMEMRKQAIDERDYDYHETVRGRMFDEFPALVTALDAALARNRELEAQIAARKAARVRGERGRGSKDMMELGGGKTMEVWDQMQFDQLKNEMRADVDALQIRIDILERQIMALEELVKSHLTQADADAEGERK